MWKEMSILIASSPEYKMKIEWKIWELCFGKGFSIWPSMACDLEHDYVPKLSSGPYFSYFSYFSLLFWSAPTFPYFSMKMPCYPYFSSKMAFTLKIPEIFPRSLRSLWFYKLSSMFI